MRGRLGVIRARRVGVDAAPGPVRACARCGIERYLKGAVASSLCHDCWEVERATGGLMLRERSAS